MRRLAPKQAVLLAGCKGTGKTLLSHAIAYHVGAMWFDISPAVLDGKYPGKETTLMLHNVSLPPLAVHRIFCMFAVFAGLCAS